MAIISSCRPVDKSKRSWDAWFSQNYGLKVLLYSEKLDISDNCDVSTFQNAVYLKESLLESHFISSYLGGGEASVIVLLRCEPSDDAGGVAQLFSRWRAAEFSQNHIGADLHRQRRWCFRWLLVPMKETSCKPIRVKLHVLTWWELGWLSLRRKAHLCSLKPSPGAAGGEPGSPCLQPEWRRTPSEL